MNCIFGKASNLYITKTPFQPHAHTRLKKKKKNTPVHFRGGVSRYLTHIVMFFHFDFLPVFSASFFFYLKFSATETVVLLILCPYRSSIK